MHTLYLTRENNNDLLARFWHDQKAINRIFRNYGAKIPAGNVVVELWVQVRPSEVVLARMYAMTIEEGRTMWRFLKTQGWVKV